MFNAFQWNCINLVYTCNIALILFLKCDVTKFRIPLPLWHTMSHFVDPLPPLTCDVIYRWPLRRIAWKKEISVSWNSSHQKLNGLFLYKATLEIQCSEGFATLLYFAKCTTEYYAFNIAHIYSEIVSNGIKCTVSLALIIMRPIRGRKLWISK